MGWENQPPFSIQEAQQRGDAVYEVLFTDWGMFQTDTYPPSFTAGRLPVKDPSLPLSIAGAAIGPRSTVDRAWLSWNFQKQFTEDALVATAGNGPLTTRVRPVSLEAPLLIPIAANPNARIVQDSPYSLAEQVQTFYETGALYVWPWSAQLHGPDNHLSDEQDFYLPQWCSTSFSDQSVASNKYFALNAGVFDGTQRTLPPPDLGSYSSDDRLQGNWVGPTLHLYLFLKAPYVSPPTKRLPLKCGYQWDSTALANNTEVCLAAIATFGRRNVRTMMWASQAGTFRVAALRVPSGVSYTRYEEPIDSSGSTPIVANTPVTLGFCNTSDFYADYTLLYYTPTGGGGVVQLNYLLSAYD